MISLNKLEKLANTIVNYSVKLKKNDKVSITFGVEAIDLVEAIIMECRKVGAVASLSMSDNRLNALVAETTTSVRADMLKKKGEFDVEMFDAFIHIRCNNNDYETKDISPEVFKLVGEATRESSDIRINEREWVLLNYPTKTDAFKAKMSSTKFFDFSFDVMTVDYALMSEEVKPLKELMDKTEMVRIVGPNTDIKFSIKDMGSVPCCGERNIPDGEIYSAPIKTSVNGVITYNTPCPYQGEVYNNVSLTFEDGRIVKACCDEDDDALNKIFDTDEGSRYVGEFALGFNPKILKPMGDILYDEKILGSLHFTPGRCYKDCDNGNISSIHWDMVLIQTEEFGGGEIYFDDVLVRKDGKFIIDNLKQLNYE